MLRPCKKRKKPERRLVIRSAGQRTEGGSEERKRSRRLSKWLWIRRRTTKRRTSVTMTMISILIKIVLTRMSESIKRQRD